MHRGAAVLARIRRPLVVGLAGALALAGAFGGGPPAGAAESGIAFRAVRLYGAGSLLPIRRRFGNAGFGQVLRLNRVDAEHAASLDTLIVPDPPDDFVAPPPLPERVSALDSLARAIVVAIRVQAFAAYDSGRLVRWGPVSTGGRSSETLPGAYHVNWKLPEHRSTVDTSWVMRWCVNLDNLEGTALHQYALPGRPMSHCCVRLLEEDARAIYDWVAEWTLARDGRSVLVPGTPVYLIGAYDFSAPPPWRRLPADPAAASLSERELAEGLRSLRESGLSTDSTP